MDGAMHFRELLRDNISPVLRARGFVRTGNRFVKWVGKNAEVLEFMTVPHKGGPLEFTLFLGTFSKRAWYFSTDSAPVPKSPDHSQCHWGHFLEAFMPEYRDRWWSVGDPTQVPTLALEILNVLESRVLRLLDSNVTDEALRDGWLTGRAPWLGVVQRLAYLVLMLHILGPRTEIPRFTEQLRKEAESTHAASVALERLESLHLI